METTGPTLQVKAQATPERSGSAPPPVRFPFPTPPSSLRVNPITFRLHELGLGLGLRFSLFLSLKQAVLKISYDQNTLL